jgi:hypothetical protein
MASRLILGLLLVSLPWVQGNKCVAGTDEEAGDNWHSPGTGEEGACLSNDKAGGFVGGWMWHCPWESTGLVSNPDFGGCGGVKYDCENTAMINTLLSYYDSHGGVTGQTLEWDAGKVQYVEKCIKFQCQGQADPGMPAAAAARRMLV